MTFETQLARDARIDVGAVIGAVVKRLPRIILVTLLLLALSYVFLMFQPRLYESSASILVEPRTNFYVRPAGEQPPSVTGGEAGVVSSQIELIKSRDTLLQVIDQLDLRSVPEFNGSASGGGFSPLSLVTGLLGRSAAPVSIDETVLATLYDRLTVIQERDSRIISVIVRSTDPQLAASIANAVASAHVRRRAQLSLSDTAEASGWLRDEIDKLRVSVKDAETAVAAFKVDNDLFVGANNTSLLDQQLSAIATQITEAQQRKNAALSRATLIRGMIDRGQPIEGIADVRDSVVIQQLSQEKARLQGERAQRAATLLPNHPTIQALNAQVTELTNQINIEGRRVADALEAEAQIEADLEASLQTDLNRAKGSAGTATQDTVTLDSLQREATAQRTLLESYLQRYNEAVSRTESNSALPDVRVVSEAAPAVTPASPKTSFVLLAVTLASLALQIGLVVFTELMSGRAIVPIAPASRPQDEHDTMPFDANELAEDKDAGPDDIIIPPVQPRQPEPAVFAPIALAAPVPQMIEVEPTVILQDDTSLADDVAEEMLVADEEQEPAEDDDADLDDDLGDDAEEAADVAVLAAANAHVLAFDDLASDLVLGRTHLLLLAGHHGNGECADLAENLVQDALARGLSVALVDAGSGSRGEDPGLTDLSLGDASFGDVVQKSADSSFAEVSWGTGRSISRKSRKPLTLVEALSDIYEVVVVMTGRVGVGSSLPLFNGLDARLVLVSNGKDGLAEVESTRQQLSDAGYLRVEVVAAPEREAA